MKTGSQVYNSHKKTRQTKEKGTFFYKGMALSFRAISILETILNGQEANMSRGTLEEIAKLSERSLKAVRHSGKKTTEEIRNALTLAGYSVLTGQCSDCGVDGNVPQKVYLWEAVVHYHCQTCGVYSYRTRDE